VYRRTFIAGTGSVLLVAPLAAEADQVRRKVPLVGLLQQGHSSDPMRSRTAEAFSTTSRVKTSGYRYGDTDGLRSLANELIGLNWT